MGRWVCGRPQLRKILLRLLLEGHSVQLGDWGSFYLTCKSEGSDTKEEVSSNNIRNLNIRFSPGKELKDAVQRASIVSSGTILGASK